MSDIYWRSNRTPFEKNQRVDEGHPLPTQVLGESLPPIRGDGRVIEVPVPGIGTAAAYADGEAFGTLITFQNVFRPDKKSGWILGAYLLDFDDEGIQVDVPLFVRPFTATTDNNAFAPSDDALRACRGVLSITQFYNWSSNQFGQTPDGTARWIKGDSEHLYTQLVVRGAANIAVGAIPVIGLVVVPD